MTIQADIEKKINDALQPDFLEVSNESHLHNVLSNSESHFKVTIVSKEFNGKMLVARHRLLNALLKDELDGPIHALSLHTLTPNEWHDKEGEIRKSPPCLGGSKSN